MKSWLKGALIGLIIFIIYFLIVVRNEFSITLLPQATIMAIVAMVIGAIGGGIYGYFKSNSGEGKFKIGNLFGAISILFFIIVVIIIMIFGLGLLFGIIHGEETAGAAMMAALSFVIGLISGFVWLVTRAVNK